MQFDNHDVSDAFDIGRGFSHGLAALQRSALPLLVGGLIMSCTEGGGGGGGSMDPSGFEDLQNMEGMEGLKDISLDNPEFVAILLVVAAILVVVALFVFALRCWIHPGYIRLQQAAIVAGEGTFGDLFSGGDRFFAIAGWKILKALVGMGVFMVAGLPGIGLIIAGAAGGGDPNAGLLAGGVLLLLLLALPAMIYVGLGLTMGELAVTIEGRGALEALERSWSLARGRRLHLLLFFIVFGIAQFIAAIVGICLLCIGALVTVPAMRSIYEVAFTEGFLLITQGEESSRSWAIWSYARNA